MHTGHSSVCLTFVLHFQWPSLCVDPGSCSYARRETVKRQQNGHDSQEYRFGRAVRSPAGLQHRLRGQVPHSLAGSFKVSTDKEICDDDPFQNWKNGCTRRLRRAARMRPRLEASRWSGTSFPAAAATGMEHGSLGFRSPPTVRKRRGWRCPGSLFRVHSEAAGKRTKRSRTERWKWGLRHWQEQRHCSAEQFSWGPAELRAEPHTHTSVDGLSGMQCSTCGVVIPLREKTASSVFVDGVCTARMHRGNNSAILPADVQPDSSFATQREKTFRNFIHFFRVSPRQCQSHMFQRGSYQRSQRRSSCLECIVCGPAAADSLRQEAAEVDFHEGRWRKGGGEGGNQGAESQLLETTQSILGITVKAQRLKLLSSSRSSASAQEEDRRGTSALVLQERVSLSGEGAFYVNVLLTANHAVERVTAVVDSDTFTSASQIAFLACIVPLLGGGIIFSFVLCLAADRLKTFVTFLCDSQATVSAACISAVRSHRSKIIFSTAETFEASRLCCPLEVAEKGTTLLYRKETVEAHDGIRNARETERRGTLATETAVSRTSLSEGAQSGYPGETATLPSAAETLFLEESCAVGNLPVYMKFALEESAVSSVGKAKAERKKGILNAAAASALLAVAAAVAQTLLKTVAGEEDARGSQTAVLRDVERSLQSTRKEAASELLLEPQQQQQLQPHGWTLEERSEHQSEQRKKIRSGAAGWAKRVFGRGRPSAEEGGRSTRDVWCRVLTRCYLLSLYLAGAWRSQQQQLKANDAQTAAAVNVISAREPVVECCSHAAKPREMILESEGGLKKLCLLSVDRSSVFILWEVSSTEAVASLLFTCLVGPSRSWQTPPTSQFLFLLLLLFLLSASVRTNVLVPLLQQQQLSFRVRRGAQCLWLLLFIASSHPQAAAAVDRSEALPSAAPDAVAEAAWTEERPPGWEVAAAAAAAQQVQAAAMLQVAAGAEPSDTKPVSAELRRFVISRKQQQQESAAGGGTLLRCMRNSEERARTHAPFGGRDVQVLTWSHCGRRRNKERRETEERFQRRTPSDEKKDFSETRTPLSVISGEPNASPIEHTEKERRTKHSSRGSRGSTEVASEAMRHIAASPQRRSCSSNNGHLGSHSCSSTTTECSILSESSDNTESSKDTENSKDRESKTERRRGGRAACCGSVLICSSSDSEDDGSNRNGLRCGADVLDEETQKTGSMEVRLLQLPLTRDNFVALFILAFLCGLGCMHVIRVTVEYSRCCKCRLCKGDYVMQYELGSGGYGTVWVVRRRRDGDGGGDSLAVLKKIQIEDITEADSYQQEARRLAHLAHEHIVGYETDFIHREHPFGAVHARIYFMIVMEFCVNGDLKQVIERSYRRLSEEKVRGWFYQLLLAVHHLHKRNIIHRDIKCQNVFLAKDGCIRLGDFGLSCTTAPPPRQGCREEEVHLKQKKRVAPASRQAHAASVHVVSERCEQFRKDMKVLHCWKHGCLFHPRRGATQTVHASLSSRGITETATARCWCRGSAADPAAALRHPGAPLREQQFSLCQRGFEDRLHDTSEKQNKKEDKLSIVMTYGGRNPVEEKVKSLTAEQNLSTRSEEAAFLFTGRRLKQDRCYTAEDENYGKAAKTSLLSYSSLVSRSHRHDNTSSTAATLNATAAAGIAPCVSGAIQATSLRTNRSSRTPGGSLPMRGSGRRGREGDMTPFTGSSKPTDIRGTTSQTKQQQRPGMSSVLRVLSRVFLHLRARLLEAARVYDWSNWAASADDSTVLKRRSSSTRSTGADATAGMSVERRRGQDEKEARKNRFSKFHRDNAMSSPHSLTLAESCLFSQAGTDCYMAPEVLNNAGYGRPADMWSLGCVLLEMCSGIFMWELETPLASLLAEDKTAEENSVTIDSFLEMLLPRYVITGATRSIIKQLLQTDPCRRPSTTELLHSSYFMQSGKVFQFPFWWSPSLASEGSRNDTDVVVERRSRPEGAVTVRKCQIATIERNRRKESGHSRTFELLGQGMSPGHFAVCRIVSCFAAVSARVTALFGEPRTCAPRDIVLKKSRSLECMSPAKKVAACLSFFERRPGEVEERALVRLAGTAYAGIKFETQKGEGKGGRKETGNRHDLVNGGRSQGDLAFIDPCFWDVVYSRKYGRSDDEAN